MNEIKVSEFTGLKWLNLAGIKAIILVNESALIRAM